MCIKVLDDSLEEGNARKLWMHESKRQDIIDRLNLSKISSRGLLQSTSFNVSIILVAIEFVSIREETRKMAGDLKIELAQKIYTFIQVQ